MRDPDPGRLAAAAARIWDGARASRFTGSDPYDGLKSALLAPLLRSRIARLALIQAVKESPVDLRRLLRVAPGLNPKALALFRAGAADMPGLPSGDEEGRWIDDALLSVASLPDGSPAFSPGRRHCPGLAGELAADGASLPPAFGWGYDFPWQGRAFFQQAWSPTVVTTGFVTDSLLHAGSPVSAAALSGAAGLVASHLGRHECPEGICFSYSPVDGTRVYNASLLGARVLARAGLEPGAVSAAADFVVSRQEEDGSWMYGEAPHWRWVDGFHTGYVLQLLEDISASLSTDRWDAAIARGLAFYRGRLFGPDGTPRSSPDRDRPVDPHSAAQGILTFLALERHCPDAAGFARAIAGRALALLWDDRRGGFVFRKGRLVSSRAIHMRWSQAWMFRALCALQRRTGR